MQCCVGLQHDDGLVRDLTPGSPGLVGALECEAQRIMRGGCVPGWLYSTYD